MSAPRRQCEEWGVQRRDYLVELLADLVLLAVIVDVADVDALAVGGLAALVDHAGRRFCVRKWVAKVKIPRAQLPSAAQSRTTSSGHVEVSNGSFASSLFTRQTL